MSHPTHGSPDEWDSPLGGLKGLSRVHLERTHLEAAVAEVRFVGDRPSITEGDAVAIWDGLGRHEFPIFEKHIQDTLNVTITPQGAVQQHQADQGWILATADRLTGVTLLPSTLVVQTRAYNRYSSSLGAPLARALALFTEVTGSSVISRLGLRYINRLTDPGADGPLFWRQHVRSSFAGPIDSDLADCVVSQNQQVQLRLDDTAGARVQSGVFQEQGPQARYSFLIDLDVFRERAITYEAISCANQVRQLNRTALALFSSILSEQYISDLGPVPLPTPNSDASPQSIEKIQAQKQH